MDKWIDSILIKLLLPAGEGDGYGMGLYFFSNCLLTVTVIVVKSVF